MKQTGDSLVILAPGKVNLSLHITGKRADGYHDLDSVMQKLDLTDRITIHCLEKPGIQLTCPGSELPENESNLVWKAAHAFLREAGLVEKCGLSIILEKRIPVAAGLGGGSSDAGAILTGLNRLLGGGLSEKTLIRLGRALGADVPFFVVPHFAVRATGIGDRMTPVDTLTGFSLLLVNPGFSVSTAWAYQNFTLTRTDKDFNLCDSRENEGVSALDCLLHNDLETVTIGRYPELGEIKKYLLDNGASGALMSGSGPTVFGIFPDLGERGGGDLQKCAKTLTKKYGDGVFITKPLGAPKIGT